IWANEERERSEVMRTGHQARVLIANENNQARTFSTRRSSPMARHGNTTVMKLRTANN
ncbi:MAG: hypothetical protein F6K47_36670, partial [Symploca sp. SIO2E6]|nr:hypothetical protein [Symploca sp. SIO2E6]